jgi:hypothetical protein
MNSMLQQSPNELPWISAWSFANKAVLPLQAADVVAYEYYRIAEKALIKKETLGFRKSAKDLFRQRDTLFFREWDKRGFELWMKKWNEESARRNLQGNGQ